MQGLKKDWEVEATPRECSLEDYMGAEPRWCPGCGDHSVLGAVQRLARDQQLQPERTVVVSGIGCSSRFPHYMKTYGFHGLHGRAFPLACGVRSRRPDLDIFVVTGDGDCCAIGTAHWIHAIRYNMDLTVLLLDNNIYGLTKMQTSPTTRPGERSNTHPKGSVLPALNPIQVTLGIENASFVAQTIDWHPPHLYATIKAAHAHRGLSFVRVYQRCPHYTSHIFAPAQADSARVTVMTHPDGIQADEAAMKLFPHKVVHDPSNLEEARKLAKDDEAFVIGLFYKSDDCARYDQATSQGIGMTSMEKLNAMERALDRFAL
ncbi:MAG: 2-oxoglutarate oxidoreductase [Acidobacteria bacterium]|nr:2-oxoglutarate oxidoreductase [Acidobacteriota bacterium]